jgi:hypothetical protein
MALTAPRATRRSNRRRRLPRPRTQAPVQDEAARPRPMTRPAWRSTVPVLG